MERFKFIPRQTVWYFLPLRSSAHKPSNDAWCDLLHSIYWTDMLSNDKFCDRCYRKQSTIFKSQINECILMSPWHTNAQPVLKATNKLSECCCAMSFSVEEKWFIGNKKWKGTFRTSRFKLQYQGMSQILSRRNMNQGLVDPPARTAHKFPHRKLNFSWKKWDDAIANVWRVIACVMSMCDEYVWSTSCLLRDVRCKHWAGRQAFTNLEDSNHINTKQKDS